MAVVLCTFDDEEEEKLIVESGQLTLAQLNNLHFYQREIFRPPSLPRPQS